MIKTLQQKEAGIPTYSKAMLSAITGEDSEHGALYLPAKVSYTVPSDLQTTHAFLFLPLKLIFLCGYHTKNVLNFAAMDFLLYFFFFSVG